MSISLLLLFNFFIIIIQMISNSLAGKYVRLYSTNTQLTWWAGEQACLDTFGTHLASVHSEEDNDKFVETCSKNGTATQACFFGLNAPDCDYGPNNGNACNWQWSDGTPYDYKNWLSGNPKGMRDTNLCENDGICYNCPQVFVKTSSIYYKQWNSFTPNVLASCDQDRVCICNAPTEEPTTNPTTTSEPTTDPTTNEPTTNQPTHDPTGKPTSDPTFDPTSDPTSNPTNDPTIDPTKYPTGKPTNDPTFDPTSNPTSDPTNDPTIDPTTYPTDEPTMEPTNNPTNEPTLPTPPTLQPNDDNGSDGIMYEHSLFVYGMILLICIYIF